MIDRGFIRSFERLVEEAYRWIADHYQPGDRLFLFGRLFLARLEVNRSNTF